MTLTRILSNPTSQNESAIAEDDDDNTTPAGPRSLLFRPTTHTGTVAGAGAGRANSPTHGHHHHGRGHFRTGSLNLGAWGGSGNSGVGTGTGTGTGTGHHVVAARERAAGVMRRLSLSGALGGAAKVRR